MVLFSAMLVPGDLYTQVYEWYATRAECTAHLQFWVLAAQAAGYKWAYAGCI